jgi:hypothetical protein
MSRKNKLCSILAILIFVVIFVVVVVVLILGCLRGTSGRFHPTTISRLEKAVVEF